MIAMFPEAQTTTTAALDTSATTITLVASATNPVPDVTTTNYFPTAPFMMNIDDGTLNNTETVRVTSMSGTTLTVARGVNGTTAKAHKTAAVAAVPGDYGETDNNPNGPGRSTLALSSGTFQLAMVVLPNEGNLTGATHEMGHGFGYLHSRQLSTSTQDYKDATDDMSAYDGTYEATALGDTFGGAVLGSLPNDKGPGLNAINLDIQGWVPGPRHYLGGGGQTTVSLCTP